MKIKVPMGISVAIALVLVAFGLFYGTWSGFREDRAGVEALLTHENGLMDVLSYRAADGLNLCVVARRHLPGDDAALVQLEKAARELQSAQGVYACRDADERLNEAIGAVSVSLRQNESFRMSQRDGKYLDMLTADLSNLSGSAAVTTYNQAARAFNQKLGGSVAGFLASLMGISQCPLYE